MTSDSRNPMPAPGRRRALGMGAMALGTIALSVTRPASAQGDYPGGRQVRIIVPFGAGGFTDTVGRLVAKGLGDLWNAPVVVENKPGAGGNLGGGQAAKSASDGYTLFLANAATNGINPAIYRNMSFDALEDFEAIALIVKAPNVVAVNNDLPVRSIAELIALAKARPGALNFGSPGAGTTGHLTGALFASVTGTEITHIPYKASPAVMTDLQSGQLQLAFDNVTSWAPQITAGRMRALAVTSDRRSPLLPDVPTMNEAGYPTIQATSWSGLAAPKGTPRAVIEKVNADLLNVISQPDFKARMNGGEVVGGRPEAFRAFIAAEIGKWTRVARSIGLTAE